MARRVDSNGPQQEREICHGHDRHSFIRVAVETLMEGVDAGWEFALVLALVDVRLLVALLEELPLAGLRTIGAVNLHSEDL